MEKIIIKYLTDTISPEELFSLRAWLQTPKNQVQFKSFVKANQKLDAAYSEVDLEAAYQKIIQQTTSTKKPVKKLYPAIVKYAAAVAVLLMVSYFFKQGFFDNDGILTIPKKTITLQLSNGEIKNISSKKEMKIMYNNDVVVGTQKGDSINYKNTASIKELAYNKLTIPYGQRFKLSLSDGTQVYLNSGSTFKYPVKFLPNQKRQVFLTGEGYFDVAKDANNAFIVNAEKLKVQVYGTQFNVSTYPEDGSTDVVLVEGSVGLIITEENAEQTNSRMIPHMLQPSFKGIFNKQSKVITQEKVNTNDYTSWIEGKLIFKNTSFKNMLKKMERHYNVTIINNNPNLDDEVYNANFGDITIYDVLEGLNTNYNIQYIIKQNKIFIE